MNSSGGSLTNFQVGVTGIVSGNSGIVCTPDPITRTGTISLNPAVTIQINALSAAVSNHTTPATWTRI